MDVLRVASKADGTKVAIRKVPNRVRSLPTVAIDGDQLVGRIYWITARSETPADGRWPTAQPTTSLEIHTYTLFTRIGGQGGYTHYVKRNPSRVA